jgi:hypothetical protein
MNLASDRPVSRSRGTPPAYAAWNGGRTIGPAFHAAASADAELATRGECFPGPYPPESTAMT